MAQVHRLRAQLDEHQDSENQIDQLIDECKKEFTRLSEDQEACQSYPFFLLCIIYGRPFYFLNLLTLALITYKDLKSIEDFKDKTVLAIKAPPQTRLEVPDPQDVCFIFIMLYCKIQYIFV